jgi:hypothetical protein
VDRIGGAHRDAGRSGGLTHEDEDEDTHMNSWINLSALWKIVVIGLLAGAGLPALFAIGLRALALRPAGAGAGADADPNNDKVVGGNPVGLVAAVVCFAVVLAAIGWGIYSIVAHS